MRDDIKVRRRGAAPKYDWPLLAREGWLFVDREPGHADQGKTLRSCARGQGYRVSVRMAEMDNVSGYLVELVK